MQCDYNYCWVQNLLVTRSSSVSKFTLFSSKGVFIAGGVNCGEYLLHILGSCQEETSWRHGRRESRENVSVR